MTQQREKTPCEEAIAMTDDIRCRLVKQRYKLGLSQAAVARYVGVTNVHMCNLEKGNVFPSWTSLYAWCDAVGFTPQIILKKSQWGVRA